MTNRLVVLRWLTFLERDDHHGRVKVFHFFVLLIIFRQSIKKVDKMAAEERVRRLRELEKEMRGHLDPLKEHMKDIVMGVQEEMLVEKFHGQKVGLIDGGTCGIEDTVQDL